LFDFVSRMQAKRNR